VELRQLAYFVSVAEHLHFGRAAAALDVGQPAVSQQVARLERELGVVLFDRSARTVRLTDAGTRFLPAARNVLAAAQHAREVVLDQSSAASRVLRLGSSTGLGDRLERVLRALGELLPTTAVELTSAPTRARLERVAAGQLDAAFVRGVTSAPGVELVEIWRDRLVVALPAEHELARSTPLNLVDLAGLPLRIVPRGQNPPLVDLVLGACASAGFTPVDASRFGTLENTLAAIATGPPSWTVLYAAHARLLNHPRVAFLPTDPELVLPTALAVPADATSRSVAPLLRACAAAVSTDAEN
jgi:DNA-binding transcriptional LysR family regulator